MTIPSCKESKVDVLIIGAGPAGVMACNALARNGIDVRIIDKSPEKIRVGQGDGIQPRTIEVLQSYGLAERLLKEGNQMHMAAFYNPSVRGGIELTERTPDVTAPSARYSFEITLHQGAIENILVDSMSRYGVEVCRNITPTAIQLSREKGLLGDPQAYPVRVVLEHNESKELELVHAKFVIGADGAHSWVRKQLNISMEGEQTDDIWGVVDMTPDTDFPDIRNRCVVHSNHGSCMIIPREGDKVRLYIQLEDKDVRDPNTGRVDKSEMGPLQLLEVARKSLRPYTIATPKRFDWWTIYIVGQRVASKFSVNDRVFIAGDACHTHSPKAGQGMNVSMGDTHNLAWKLTHVLRGWADISILKTYEFERRKYAQNLIAFDKQFAKLFSGKPRTEECQDGVSHEEFLKIFQTFGGFTSGIGIHYAESPITRISHQRSASHLVIGQRMPPQTFIRAADSRPVELQDLLPSDARFKFLVFTGNSSDSEQRKKINAAAAQLGLVLQRFAPLGKKNSVFDIISISSATKANVRYNDLPQLLRSHWSKVLIDDTDVTGIRGGGGYKVFGISKGGVVVVVRPDGYVGALSPLEQLEGLRTYFGAFNARGAITINSQEKIQRGKL